MTISYKGWQAQARRMVADACLEEYRKVNPVPGKKHVQYSIPEWCDPLLKAVEEENEVEAKRIMMVVRVGCFTLV